MSVHEMVKTAYGAVADTNTGLGCGDPTSLALLKPGETVVDLGSGAGFDALTAAPLLGDDGRFIGIDMTPEMLARARKQAIEAGFARSVEFREGVIEALPVTSASADVVISNCVINLSPRKDLAFTEAFRVLKPGGRLAVSDILLSEPLPEPLRSAAVSWAACIGGAMSEAEYIGLIEAAGFVDITFTRTPAASMLETYLQDPTVQAVIAAFGEAQIAAVADTVFSYSISARKP